MKICSAPWFNLTIHSSGKAVMCCIDYKLEYIVGDTNEQTLEEILYGEILERVRQQHLSGSLNFSPCNKCDVSGTFMGHTHAKVWQEIK